MVNKKIISVFKFPPVLFLIFIIAGYISVQGYLSFGNLAQDDITEEDILTLTVDGREYAFEPTTLKVEKGAVVHVIFNNVGNLIHNFDISEFSVESGNIQPKGTITLEFTADKEGEFSFVCGVPGHKELGMVGKIIVESTP